jgi:RNA polymerase sigma factor (sigma-70 family)
MMMVVVHAPAAVDMSRRHDAALDVLTTAVRALEPWAVEEFHRRYVDVMMGVARQVSHRDLSFCWEVVQDAMLRVLRCIRPILQERQLVAWLRIVVQTTTYDRLRAEQRRLQHERAAADQQNRQSADDHGEQIAWLRKKLSTCSPGLAELIDLRYARGWTLQRIASHLRLTPSAVDGRLRRLLEQLRQEGKDLTHG